MVATPTGLTHNKRYQLCNQFWQSRKDWDYIYWGITQKYMLDFNVCTVLVWVTEMESNFGSRQAVHHTIGHKLTRLWAYYWLNQIVTAVNLKAVCRGWRGNVLQLCSHTVQWTIDDKRKGFPNGRLSRLRRRVLQAPVTINFAYSLVVLQIHQCFSRKFTFATCNE